MACVLLVASCRGGPLEPVEIAPEDMCAYCRMAISEKRFASQFIDRDGEAFKFDDVGCMSNFIRSRQDRNEIAAFFVADFETRQWLKAEEAFYVHSAELRSPMSGNTAAFKDEARAQAAVAGFNGKLLHFNDLLP